MEVSEMAIQPKKTGRALPKPHKFVSALQRKKVGSSLIRGFIGKASKARYLRVYLDVELKRFVEVPEKAVLHFEDLRAQHGPAASVVLWVDQEAQIRHFGNWAASDDPTTMATGEEGGGDPTTMATGEESVTPFNPLDEVSNPFGRFG
jgi:hypothetical protein